MSGLRGRILGFILATLLLLLCWHVFSLLLNKAFLPTPWASAAAFIDLSLHGDMAKHFLISTLRVLTGIVIALPPAVALGLVLGRIPFWDRLLSPLVHMLYPLPKVVFLPVFVVLLGLGNLPKVLLIAVVIFFQIIVVTRDAARDIPQASVQSMRSLNADPRQTLLHLLLPCCLPRILTSLRITLGTAIAVLFFAETFASFDGLGYYILNGMETREYASMYAGIIALALLGLLLYAVVDLLERSLCRWQKYQ
jgi:NitT/TauT family transport system permease protein